MFDLCMTDIIRDNKYNTSDYNSRKWSAVIGLADFETFREEANLAYKIMTEGFHYCPEVRRVGRYGMEIEWHTDDRIVQIRFEVGLPTTFCWGAKEKSPYKMIPFTQPYAEMLLKFSAFLSYEGSVKDGNKVRYRGRS